MNGEALRLIRILNNKKSKDLAEQLEISSSYLSQIENNKRKPTLEIIVKYADIFSMRASTLLFLLEEYQDVSFGGKAKSNTKDIVLNLMKTLEKFGGYENEK
jgi:transcriptional regulator with XRE-family HTH domain